MNRPKVFFFFSEIRTIIDPTEVKGGVLLLASANYIITRSRRRKH